MSRVRTPSPAPAFRRASSPSRVAHSSRVLVSASRRNELLGLAAPPASKYGDKVREDETSSPALETSALPERELSRRRVRWDSTCGQLAFLARRVNKPIHDRILVFTNP